MLFSEKICIVSLNSCFKYINCNATWNFVYEKSGSYSLARGGEGTDTKPAISTLGTGAIKEAPGVLGAQAALSACHSRGGLREPSLSHVHMVESSRFLLSTTVLLRLGNNLGK